VHAMFSINQVSTEACCGQGERRDVPQISGERGAATGRGQTDAWRADRVKSLFVPPSRMVGV